MARKQSNNNNNRVTTQLPAARGQISRNTMPRMVGGQASTIVKHRELLANPTHATDFTQIQLAINPGYQASFPWLGKVAGAYELYRFRKLSFEYVPQVATSVSGTAGMYFDYDPTDGVANDIIQFSNMYLSKVSQIWQGFKIDVDCPAKMLFTRNGTPLDDLKLYDVGTFNFFIQTPFSGTGLFYIDYEVELFKPHNHLDTTLYADDIGFARWGNASSGVVPTATPGVKDNKFIWGEGGDAGKFQVPTEGTYQVEANCVTPNGSAINQICGVARTGLLSTATNALTNVSAILSLAKDIWYTPFSLTAGVIGANSTFEARLLSA